MLRRSSNESKVDHKNSTDATVMTEQAQVLDAMLQTQHDIFKNDLKNNNLTGYINIKAIPISKIDTKIG